MRLVLACITSLLLSACADSRLIRPQDAGEAPTIAVAARNPDGVGVRVRQRVLRDGPGSWIRDPSWDEYVLALDNGGVAEATVTSITLASAALDESQHTTERTRLESQSEQNIEALKRVGLGALLGTAVTSTAMTAAFMSAGWTLVTPAAPIALAAGGIYAWFNLSQRNRDGAIIDHQLERRGLQLPATLPAGTDLAGSAFFPLTPAATTLRVRYPADGEERELVLDLAALADERLALEKAAAR